MMSNEKNEKKDSLLKRIDVYLDKKLSSEDEQDRRDRYWAEEEVLQDILSECDEDVRNRVLKTFQRMNRLDRFGALRKSLAVTRVDKRIANNFKTIRDSFQTYIESAYAMQMTHDEHVKKNLSSSMDEFENTLQEYEEAVAAMAVNKSDYQNKKKKNLLSLLKVCTKNNGD